MQYVSNLHPQIMAFYWPLFQFSLGRLPYETFLNNILERCQIWKIEVFFPTFSKHKFKYLFSNPLPEVITFFCFIKWSNKIKRFLHLPYSIPFRSSSNEWNESEETRGFPHRLFFSTTSSHTSQRVFSSQYSGLCGDWLSWRSSTKC